MGTESGTGYEDVLFAVLKNKFHVVDRQHKTDWIGLFSQQIRVDFLCDAKLCIEVKWQSVSGTSDQKIVYALEQIKTCHKLPTILIMGGTGWNKGSLSWVKSQEKNAIFMGAFTTDEFLAWVMKK